MNARWIGSLAAALGAAVLWFGCAAAAPASPAEPSAEPETAQAAETAAPAPMESETPAAKPSTPRASASSTPPAPAESVPLPGAVGLGGTDPSRAANRQSGSVSGDVTVAVAYGGARSSTDEMNRLKTLAQLLDADPATDLKLTVERAQATGAIDPTVTLLFLGAAFQRNDPAGLTRRQLTQLTDAAVKFAQDGGFLVFGDEIPGDFQMKGTVQKIAADHPLMTTPFKIEGIAKGGEPEVLVIGGAVVGVVGHEMARTPGTIQRWVNIIAYGLSRKQAGQ